MIWHSSEVSEVLSELSVDEKKGLANGVADMRLEQYGKNAISNIEKPSFAKHFFAQLNSKYVYLLTAVAVISFIISLIYKDDSFYSPLILIGIVLINALVSAYHLYRSENALNTLKSVTNPLASVLRDGITKQVPSDELVPGDIIYLKEGDYITADARLIEVNSFRCNESVISGLNIPVEKKAGIVLEDITPLDERVNMVFAGCSVIHGTATAVVVETGLNTEAGRTSAIIQQTGADALPLQSALDNTGKIVNALVLAVCALTFIIGMIQNFAAASFASMTVKTLLNSVALAVAAIPEGLPMISTIVIALGIQRIMSDDIIIKKTQALECLGKTTVICSDKTGILTRNKMTLSRIYDGEKMTEVAKEELSDKSAMVLRLAAACSTLDRDSTERAIKNACIEYNSMAQEDVENIFPRLCIIPFDSDRKTMTSINMINGKPVAIVKGAPESLLQKCVGCNAEEILKLNDEMAAEALRVVCIAIRELEEIPANPNPDDIECGLTFAGLIGITDPPRLEAIEGISTCSRAGIKTVMITGDNLITAKAIARRIGILRHDTQAISGAELAELSDEELRDNIGKYTVFARVSPADKLRIINAFKENGETVTVTGDSLSDSEALFAADVGCAMGRLGTDVAKGNADIITASNSFITLVRAIKESRGLFANIKRTVSYMLSCNFAELAAYIAGMLIFRIPPLAAAQLLCMNLLTDCAPVVALSTERPEGDIMESRSKTSLGHIFSPRSLIAVAAQALFMAVTTLIAFMIGRKSGDTAGMTMAFVTLASAQIFHAFNHKSGRSVFTVDLKSSRFLITSTVLTLFVIFFLALTPVGSLMGLEILGGKQFVTSVALAFAVIPFCEIIKLVMKLMKR